MRKNLTRILAAVAASFAALSCMQANLEEEPLNLLPNQYVATFESSESDAAPDTKVSLASDNTTVKWDKGDEIYFVSNKSENVSTWKATTVDQNGKRAVFSISEGSASASAKFAVYPTNEVDVNGQKITCFASGDQSGLFKDANVMVAKIVDQTLNFKQVFGIFEFKVTDSKVKSIEVSCPGIRGGVVATFGNNDSDRNITATTPVYDGEVITVSNITPGTWYVAVRPGTYDAGTINISYLGDKDAVITSVAYPKILTVHRKDIIAFGDISEHTTLSGTLPDGKTFNSYMKQLAGELKNITWIQFYRNISNPTGDIKIADDVYMSYGSNGTSNGISIKTSASQYQANEDCSHMFYGCWNVESIIGLSNVNTSATTNMSSMFSDCYKLVNVEPTHLFTTANVTNMCNMFYQCEKLEELDLTTFDTRKVTNTAYMFQYCYALNKVYLGNNFIISDGCFTDDCLMGCGATFYGTTAEMESFISSGFDEYHSIKFAIDMDDAGWWSAWNIGAEKPSDYGYYYSWGNSAGHWKNGTSDGYSFTESAYKSTSGYSMTTDWKNIPTWSGSQWRVPGKSDFENLKKVCNVSRTTKNGVSGTLYHCKYNGNEIFLPDAGRVFESSRINGTFYWTRENSNTAVFDSQNASFSTEDASHFIGYPIRPIAKHGDVAVTGVSLDKTSMTVPLGKTVQLTATVTPSNASVKSITWTSSNTSVATVNSTGIVTGVSEGSATITATTDDGSKKATCNITVSLPNGALPGVFSVSPTKKVRFSRGNLQATYNGFLCNWDFAARQIDYVGAAPGNTSISSLKTGDVIDLFGWSTDETYFGISESNHDSDYEGDFIDWGTALNRDVTWRTLTYDEWRYVLGISGDSKSTRGGLCVSRVTVVGKPNCVVLYPDGFTGTKATEGDTTTYDTDAKMGAAQLAGVVFLPAAGYRNGSSVYEVGNAYYWSSSPEGHEPRIFGYFYANAIKNGNMLDEYRDRGLSVRLVADTE